MEKRRRKSDDVSLLSDVFLKESFSPRKKKIQNLMLLKP